MECDETVIRAIVELSGELPAKKELTK